VNCAGRSINEPDVTKYTRKQWDPMVALNLTAAFEMSHECAKHMIPQGSGKIINICSVFTFLGGQWSPAYAATKHGIAGFTKAYCDELAQFGIQVNGIAPGYYATELTSATRANADTNQRVLDHIPANRWGQTQDLMGATVFLASRASDYVNGHILSVDGDTWCARRRQINMNLTMTKKYILGIDGGSQSSKVVIFDTEGRVVCEASQALKPLYTPEPGVVEHPDDDLYDSIVAAASRAMQAFQGDPADIIGVGLCSIRCCRALTRADGTLVEPVQSWMDERLSRPYEPTNEDVAYVTTTSGYLMGRLTGSFPTPSPTTSVHGRWMSARGTGSVTRKPSTRTTSAEACCIGCRCRAMSAAT
jgi:hypothetical protein